MDRIVCEHNSTEFFFVGDLISCSYINYKHQLILCHIKDEKSDDRQSTFKNCQCRSMEDYSDTAESLSMGCNTLPTGRSLWTRWNLMLTYFKFR